MPSGLHETLVAMIGRRPSMVADLLVGALGVDLPAHRQARLERPDCTDLAPTEFRADAVVVLSDATGPVQAVVVEVQLGRDPHKRLSWPVYLTTLRARLSCPTLLLVVCVDTAIASWCATPIELGHPGLVLAPLVIGPGRVPVVTDPRDAALAPELTVLSALAHRAHPDCDRILDVLVDALATIETEHAVLYSRLVLAALPESARKHMEALMSTETYEYESDFTRRYTDRGRVEGRAEGRAEAKAADVLTVLGTRGVHVPADARARIVGCSDLERLDVWLRRAVTAGSIEDLFD